MKDILKELKNRSTPQLLENLKDLHAELDLRCSSLELTVISEFNLVTILGTKDMLENDELMRYYLNKNNLCRVKKLPGKLNKIELLSDTQIIHQTGYKYDNHIED